MMRWIVCNLVVTNKNKGRFMFKPLLKPISALVILLVCISSAYAVQLKPGHPVEYVVKEGDTLWDLSQKYLSVKQRIFNIPVDALISTLSIWVPESIKR